MNFALTPFANSVRVHDGASSAASDSPSSSTDPQHRKLTDAAQQFEGMLLQELLKPMRERSFGSGDTESSSNDTDSSGFADTLSSFGAESLATAISRSGGLGIAKLVTQRVEHEKNGHPAAVQNR